MRITSINVGDAVNVRLGGGVRPAVVMDVRTDVAKVCVKFTDVPDNVTDPTHPSFVPADRRGNLLAATVRANAVQAA